MKSLNFYKIYWKSTNRVSEFLTHTTLELALRHEKKEGNLEDVEVFALNMPNVTEYLAIMQELKGK